MTQVYVISDLHLGHKNILKFSGQYRDWCTTVDEHDYGLIERIKLTCRKKTDILYILGDVAMDESKLELLNEIQCRKILVRGNHDNFDDSVYHKYFECIEGITRHKNNKFWLTHAPIHPDELRGRVNIHGHVHFQSIRNMFGEIDNRYVNACVENCNGWPIKLEDIKNGTFEGVIR